MSLVRDRVLLVSRHPFSESSLVVHGLTRDHGRVHWIAKGAYRTTSRYFAVLDLFDTLELEWEHSPRRELDTLRAGRVLCRRRGLTSHLGAYHAGLSALELADWISRPAQPDVGLFDLLERTLEELHLGLSNPDRVLVVFELALLQNLGLAPALETCAACAGLAEPVTRDGMRVAFSAGAGGRLCQACATEARAAGRRVGTLPLAVLCDARELIQPHDAQRDIAPQLSQDRIDRVRDFVERFVDYHLEGQPRTHKAFLSTPNRNAANLANEPA